jgi:hypothetical protein
MNGLSKFTAIKPGDNMKELRVLPSAVLFVLSTLVFLTCEAAEYESIELLKSSAVGDEIRSEHEVYKIIPNGDVLLARDEEQIVDSASSISWSQHLGSFRLSIDQRPKARSNSSAIPASKYQLAFNPRTGRPAVITGQVITRLVDGANAEAIAVDFGLTLTANFPHLNAAVFQVKYPNTLAQNVALLSADVRVTQAYAEVIENMPTTR